MKDQLRKQIAAEIEKLNREKKYRNKRKEGTSKPSPKTSCFVNKITQISQATSNTYKLNFIVDIPHCSKASSSEEEDIGIRKGRRKIHVEVIHEEVKVSSSEE